MMTELSKRSEDLQSIVGLNGNKSWNGSVDLIELHTINETAIALTYNDRFDTTKFLGSDPNAER